MRLELRIPYKSIRSLAPVDLPGFSLITGINGAGKSQLLAAIAAGSVTVDGSHRQIRGDGPISATAFVPSSAEFESYQLSAKWRPQIAELSRDITEVRFALRRTLAAHGQIVDDDQLGRLIDDPSYALSLQINDPESLVSIATTEIGVHTGHLLEKHRHNSYVGIALANISKISRRGILNLAADDLELPLWGAIEDNNQISTVFVNYRDTLLRNRLKRLSAELGDEVTFLTEVEFRERYGDPPWEVVDRVMRQMGLRFTITLPDLYEATPYRPMLVSDGDGARIPFNELSSGESVLLGLALSSYDKWDRRISAVRSSLLLLDELDAPLHPAMSKNYIHTILDEIVGRQKVDVIATTHSLATVALAPEAAIHVLRTNPHRLEKVSKAQALNILSEGVPTLAIDFSGRRQVFCESEYDARAYAAVYENVRRSIGLERSLDFVAASVTGGSGDIAGGKEVVLNVVGQLERSGNGSVFGIIDWDGRNEPVGRVQVLARGKRNGLENVLFDPLMLAGLIALRFEVLRPKIGLPKTASIDEVKCLKRAELQAICDLVQKHVLGEFGTLAQEDVTYFGGLRLQVASSYLAIDDHELGDRVLTAFPEFRSISRHQSGGGAHGRLMEEIGRSVARDFVEFLPSELVASLRSLLEAEPVVVTP